MDFNDPAYDEYLSTGIDPTGDQISGEDGFPCSDDENPFAIIREEEWTEDNNGVHIVHIKSYDSQDRVVGISTQMFRDGVQISHFAEYVEADGFWRGGACNDETGMGCQTCHPFIEGEVQ